MPSTVPNQRTIKIHRERASSDFLGIKNKNWQAAARDLRPHALSLYLYLAANADNYQLALSPAAVRQSIGMARSTFHDQFQVLVDKGYLIHSGLNSYDFYETPKPELINQNVERPTPAGLNFEDSTNLELEDSRGVNPIPSGDIEINIDNKNNIINSEEQAKIEVPKVKEIIIQNPSAEPKVQIKQDWINKPFEEFIF